MFIHTANARRSAISGDFGSGENFVFLILKANTLPGGSTLAFTLSSTGIYYNQFM
jgi:hypothetical protein